MKLGEIPEKYFEVGGLVAGFSASAFIAWQVFSEAMDNTPSSLSYSYVIGFM